MIIAVCILCTALLSVNAFGKKIQETLTYSDYVIENKRQSKIDPSKTIIYATGLACPGTKDVVNPIDHGESVQCPNGDKLTRWGNSLDIVGYR